MTKTDPVTAYALDAVAGRIPLCRWARLACERHLRDLDTAAERGLRWVPDDAEFVIDFIELLPQRKGEWQGQPIRLQGWQRFRIGCFFGWRRLDGRRRFRTAYNEVPRGMGKTTEAAGVANYLAWLDGEPGAEVYTVATKREQARVCWEEARWQLDYAASGPDLAARLGIDLLAHNMHQQSTASKLQPLGADTNSGDAINPHGYVYDEIHAWNDREYRDKLDTALVKRRQPVKWQITTAGTVSSTLWLEEREYAMRVLDGVISDDSYFAWISKVDDEEAWESEEEWAKACPNLGVTVNIETLRETFKKAREKPSELANAKRLHLGIVAQSSNPWLALPLWDAQEAGRSADDLIGATCYMGLDLSSTTDLTALAMWFPDGPDAGDLLAEFWLPGETVEERVRRDRVPYDVWIDAGYIHKTVSAVVDYDAIYNRILELAERYQIHSIGVDPWNGSQLVRKLEEAGFTVLKIPQFIVRLSTPTKELERLVKGRGFRHGGNPVLRWMASHAVAITDANENVRLDKGKSGDRIDGLAATINAISEAMAGEPDYEPSFYT